MAKRPKAVELDFLQPAADVRPRASGMFTPTPQELQQARLVELDRLGDNPYQPRFAMNPATLEELAKVIESQGFQGVLIARPHPEQSGRYQLTAGHRRRDAARLAGKTELPVIVRDLSNEEMATISITENIQREDLTPLEEGKIFLMMDQEMGYTHEQIAREIGKKRGYVENRLRLARAPQDIQELIQAKPDSLRAVANLIKVKDAGRRAELIRQHLAGTITVDDLVGLVEESNAPAAPAVGAGPGTTINPSGGPYRYYEVDEDEEYAGDTPYTPEQALARVGAGKLMTALRTLRAYHKNLRRREGLITRREAAHLEALAAVLEEIQQEARPDEQG